jgi:hypothetical protein
MVKVSGGTFLSSWSSGIQIRLTQGGPRLLLVTLQLCLGINGMECKAGIASGWEGTL